jgi:SAM-dependent methyltransferase
VTAVERLPNDPRSELWGEHRSRYRFAAEHVRGRLVLDMACGSGFGLAMLGDAGATPIGMDLSADGLSAAAAALNGHARLAQADAARLPLPHAALDVVVSFETLEHVPDPDATLAEFRRVLRPAGTLILSTPNRAFGPEWLHTGNPFHLREYTAAELRARLGAHFAEVRLFGQWPSAAYRYVPFLLVERSWEPAALAWKVLNRLPPALREWVARRLSGRPFYPGEDDYHFLPERTDGSHDLVAVAWGRISP